MRTRSAIVGYAILTVLLTAGAAQGLSGSDTVFTDDIKDGQVTRDDLATSAVNSTKVANESLTGVDINEASIPGFKKVFFARVKGDGNQFAGDATASAKLGPGRYSVTFAFPPDACAAVASASRSKDFIDSSSNAFATTNTTDLVGNSVEVVIRPQEPTNTDALVINSAFALVLVCP
jgi:hypothetical protein